MLVDRVARRLARHEWLVRYARWATARATWLARWHFYVGLALVLGLLVFFVDC